MVTLGDNPIEDPSDDLLGREATGKNLANVLREVDASQGSVFAVVGPWGSGKTSLMNLARRHLDESPSVPVIDFNPWMFSGTEQLVDAFFRELAAQLRLKEGRLARIAGEVEAYGALLSPLSVLPVVGSWFERLRGAGKAVKDFQQRRSESVSARRSKLSKLLAELDTPIVVVIDDIDRLETTEIRDIFKLVRLTASFPNILYVLAFDRARVEEALSENGIDGRSYLEKIVQIVIDVPSVPKEELVKQLGIALDGALADLEPVRFDNGEWPDVLAEIVFSQIRNMRDVRRYAASVRPTARALGDRVELVDVLGLEAVRIFEPEMFLAVVEAQVGLTTTQDIGFGSSYEDPRLKQSVMDLVAAASDEEMGRSLVKRLFPAGRRHIENYNFGSDWQREWLKARRVAHIDILRLYIEQVVPEGLRAFSDAERAFAVLDDEIALSEFLHGLELDRVQDVVAALENFQEDYPAAAAIPASTVLFNIMGTLPVRQKGMFLFIDARMAVIRVVLRLLRRLNGEQAVKSAVDAILLSLTSWSSRAELVLLVGHKEDAGSKLVSEDDSRELFASLASDVRSSSAEDLIEEWNLITLLFVAGDGIEPPNPILHIRDNFELNAKVLIAASSEVRSQSIDSRAVRREQRLDWDALIKLYGTEENLKRMIEELRASEPTDPKLIDTLALADKYISGEVPDKFGN